LEAGAQLLNQRGYHGTGLKEILDHVRVPKGSFYNYFESKEQFGAEVVRHYTCRTMESLDAAGAAHPGRALDALRFFFDSEADRHRSGGGCLMGNLSAEIGQDCSSCQNALVDGMKAIESRLAALLRAGQEQGTVRGDVPAGDLAAFLFNAWEGSLVRMKVCGSAEPLEGFSKFGLDDLIRPRAFAG